MFHLHLQTSDQHKVKRIMFQIGVKLCIGLCILLLPGVAGEECLGCGDNALCQNDVCSCPAGLIGDARVHCYPNGTKFCSLTSDPILRAFSGEKIHVTIVGATRLADFVVTRKIGNIRQKCKLVLWALSERIKGKLFIDGFQLKFTRVESNGASAVTDLFVKANAINGIVNWDFRIDTNFFGNFRYCCSYPETFGDEGSCDVDYSVTPNNFFLFTFNCCNISLGVRPQIPGANSTAGIWVEANSPDVSYEEWLSGFEPICLGHDSYDIESVVSGTQLGDPWDAMSYLSLTNNGNLTYEGEPQNFTQLGQALRSCNQLARLAFYDDAVFALDTPPFIRCISNTTVDQDGLVEFLLLVLDWFCVGDLISCAAAKQMVSDKCQAVINSYPSVQAFLNKPC